MRKITPNEIQKLVDRSLTKIVLEKLTVKVGDEYVIQPGLKIKSKESGVEYTVSSPIRVVDNGLRLDIERVVMDDKTHTLKTIKATITQDDFDSYDPA
jgi:hypothetical protein